MGQCPIKTFTATQRPPVELFGMPASNDNNNGYSYGYKYDYEDYNMLLGCLEPNH